MELESFQMVTDIAERMLLKTRAHVSYYEKL